jgi:peptidyl-prolyl cis-trans isomerase D
MYTWKDKKIDKSLDRGKAMRNSFAYLVLFMALGAMVFFGVCSPKSSQMGVSAQGPAAKIDGEEVSYQEFRRAYENAYQRYQRIYAEAFDPGQIRLAQNVLNNLVEERVIYSEADRLGLMASDEEVDKQVLQIFKDEKTGKFDAERFSNVLQSNGFNEATFQEQMRRGITVNRFRQLLSETAFVSSKAAELDYQINETKLDVDYLKFDKDKVQVTVSADEISKFLNAAGKKQVSEYYTKNKSEFVQEKKVRARHILIAYKGAERASGEAQKRSKEDAKKKAEQIAIQVKGGGADFAQAATRETDEVSGKTKGGDLGFFAHDDMAKEFADAAFKMKPSEISGVVESPFGFHIIKVEAIQDAVSRTEADATQDIARKILEKDKRPAAIAAQAKEVLDAVKSGNATAVLAKYGLTWQSTGSFAASAASIPKIGSGRPLRDAILSLKKPGQVYDGVIDEGGSSYILKLKSFTPPDLAKLDKDKVHDLAKNAAYTQASSLFNMLKDKAQKERQDGGDIWLNEGYLAIDQPRTKEGT